MVNEISWWIALRLEQHTDSTLMNLKYNEMVRQNSDFLN